MSETKMSIAEKRNGIRPVASAPHALTLKGRSIFRVRRMENHRFKSDTYSSIGYQPVHFPAVSPISYVNVLVEAASTNTHW